VAKTMLFIFSVGVFAISLGSSTSSYAQTACGCWQFRVLYDSTCSSSSPPCESSYPVGFCDTGCSYGHCGPMGWGTCCGKSWRTYGIYGGTQCGGNQDCGTGCGLAREHASSHAGRHLHRGNAQRQSLRNVHSVLPEERANYLAYEAALLVPDRCQHTYGILYIHSLRQQTSATPSRQGSVPGGGL
jgi:hypothetical protein